MSDPGQPAPARPRKSAAAFRTIGEAAGELDLPAHVLRFWETKFPRIKPVKRGGGRRYYRPEDILLLRRIRQWLYQDGYTIRGVQQLLETGSPSVAIAVEASDAAGSSAAAVPDTAAGVSAGVTGRPEADATGLLPTEQPPTRERKPACLDPETRAELDEIRRDLRQVRALLDGLLASSKTA